MSYNDLKRIIEYVKTTTGIDIEKDNYHLNIEHDGYSNKPNKIKAFRKENGIIVAITIELEKFDIEESPEKISEYYYG